MKLSTNTNCSPCNGAATPVLKILQGGTVTPHVEDPRGDSHTRVEDTRGESYTCVEDSTGRDNHTHLEDYTKVIRTG